MSRPGCKIKVSQASPRAGLPPAPTRCALLLAGGSAGRRPARLRCGNRSSSRRLRCSEAAGNRAGHPAAVHSQRSPLLVKRVLLLVQGGQWTPCRFEGTWITQKKPGGEGGGGWGRRRRPKTHVTCSPSCTAWWHRYPKFHSRSRFQPHARWHVQRSVLLIKVAGFRHKDTV